MFSLVATLCVSLLAQPELETLPKFSTPEFEAMKKRVAQDRVKVTFLRREEASILGAVGSIDRQIANRSSSVRKLGAQVKKLESTITRLNEEILENEEALAETRERAGVRLRGLHRLQRTSLSDLFQQVTEPGRVRRFRDYLSRVMSYDAELIGAARSASDGARNARDAAEVKKTELEALREEHEKDATEGAILREQRAQLLTAVRKERKSSEQLASEIAQAAKKLERELGVVRGSVPSPEPAPGNFEAQRGRLPWPVAGRVEVPFGKKVDPGSGMVMAQKGLDLRATFGTAVRAVFAGRVVYSDWFDGFGRMAIVEHEGGFYTLYAHLDSFQVEKGGRVEAHAVLGTVGESGSSKGAYLYFEVRRGKEPVDPLKWLAP